MVTRRILYLWMRTNSRYASIALLQRLTHVLTAYLTRSQRVNGQHDLLYQLLGRHYRGPVRRVLRGRRRVLDLCTGTGRWCVETFLTLLFCAWSQSDVLRVLDMAHDFPNVRFDGIDIGAPHFSCV